MDLVLKNNSTSYFRLVQAVAVFSSLLSVFAVLQPSFGGTQEKTNAVENDRDAEVNALIRKLQDLSLIHI